MSFAPVGLTATVAALRASDHEQSAAPRTRELEQRAGTRASVSAPREPHEQLIELLWDAYWTQPSDGLRNLLVESYQPLVRAIVRRFAARLPRSVDRGDLVTAANVGLMNAIGAFDPHRRVPFESYCERRVKGALLDELRSQDWLPRPWRARIELHKRTIEGLRARLGRDPLDDEVASALEMPLDEYQLLFGNGLPGGALGSRRPGEAGEDQNGTLDVVADPRGDSPDDRLGRDELLALVAQRMSEVEYRLVYLKYWEDLSMREIGQLLELSESRVCKIHGALLERLKERLKERSGV